MTCAVVPVRSFRLGKQRLSAALSTESRTRVGQGLAERVASALRRVDLVPVVVTGDPEVAAWARSSNIRVVDDPGDGLNGAARAGVEWVIANGDRWLVVHADLPLIRAEDLTEVGHHIEEGRDVIAPSADGGTSLLSARDPIQFAYGPASFHRHLPRLTDPVVVVRTGLLHDLDAPEDLTSALTRERGAWLEEIYWTPELRKAP